MMVVNCIYGNEYMYRYNHNSSNYYIAPLYYAGGMYCPYQSQHLYQMSFPRRRDEGRIQMKDYGPEPFVVNIEEAAEHNSNFRSALWTGRYLQLVLMSLNVGEEIGLEVHDTVDQFIRIEEGQGVVMMGDQKDNLDFQENVYEDYAFIVPAGKWHNLINTGNQPLKLYTIYAPPQHPHGTNQRTKEEAMAAEEHNR